MFVYVRGKTSFSVLYDAAFHPDSITMFFQAYMFWTSVLFIPLAIICAFATKYGDYREGLTFKSNNVVAIIFAHIAEELLGLFLTPFWFLKDLFSEDLDDGWKIFDYISYALEIVIILIGIFVVL